MQVFKLSNYFVQMSLVTQHHAWADTRILKKCATAIFKVDRIISSDLVGGVEKPGQLQRWISRQMAKPWNDKGQVDVGPGQQEQ